MTTVIAVLLFVLGIYLTMRGGDALVEAASFISSINGIPKIMIGVTLVSITTTIPTLLISLLATRQGASDMAIGTVIGTACCNIGLILGISLAFSPIRLPLTVIRGKGTTMIVASMLLGIFCVGGVLDTPRALVLLLVLALFFWLNLRAANCGSQAPAERMHANTTEKTKKTAQLILSSAAIVLGTQLMVDQGVLLACLFGISQGIIGLTLVAMGTALPALFATLSALRHGETALSVGNALGATILNFTLVPAVCTLAAQGTLAVDVSIAARDAPAAFILCAIAILPSLRTGRFNRWQGIALLAVYCGYIAGLLL